MADRIKFGYMNYDEIADRLNSGKLNVYDAVFTKDTEELIFITPNENDYIRVKGRIDVYASILWAEYYLNRKSDSYIGQIVGIQQGDWVMPYMVNYADDKFIVKPVTIDEYRLLNGKPSINGVELNGDKTSEQLGINIPTKVSDLQNDLEFVTSEHLLENFYTKVQTYSKAETYSQSQVNALLEQKASVSDIPTTLSQLTEDSTHRTVTDEEKAQWTSMGAPDWNVNDSSMPGYIKNKPTKLSQFVNDESFVTSTANNLVNYYLKSEVYTKGEVSLLISSITVGEFVVVQQLPQTGEPKNIYLVPKQTTSTNNIYDEYIWINNAWECIGSTTIDLSNYVTFTDLSNALNDYLTSDAFATAIANYYTKDEVDTKLSGKANAADLANVATSGNYNDLSNKPSIPDDLADLNEDSTHRTVTDVEKQAWNAAEENVQSDWNQTNNTKDDYIKNKPQNLVQDASYVHTDNNYTTEDKTRVSSLGSASTYDAPESGDASEEEVVLGSDSRLSDARTPLSHTHTKSEITDFPNLGTASAYNVPVSGNAGQTEVVKGDDTRLSDARTPVSHTHTLSEITDSGTAAAKNFTTSVSAESTDLVTSGAVKTAIDNAVASSYHHAGTKTVAELTSALLIAENQGNVYNITDSGTTTADFIEGAGHPIDVGANVGVAKVCNAYKFDLLSGFVDTSNFVEKSSTSGLLKNDGSVDTKQYVEQVQGKGLSTNDYDNTAKSIVDGVTSALSGKVDKVEGKGLSTEDYTTAEKNKLTGISTNAKKVEASSTNGYIKIDGVETKVYDDSGKQDKLPFTFVINSQDNGIDIIYEEA